MRKTWKAWRREKPVAGGRQYEAFELGALLPGVLKYLGRLHHIEVENAAVVTTRGIQRRLSRRENRPRG